MVGENTVPDETTQQETTEEVGEEQTQEQTEEGQEQTQEPEIDYKARYEEAQRLITEKSELAAQQDRLLRASAEIIRGNANKTETEKAGAGTDDFDSILDGVDFDHMVDNPKETMKVALKKVYQKAKEDSQKEIVQRYTQNQAYIANVEKAQQQFYGTNKDLVGQEDLVAVVSQQIWEKNRGISQEELFDKTAKAVRTRIAEFRKGGGVQKPLPLEGQGSQNTLRKPSSAKETLSAIDDYMKERREATNKKATPHAYNGKGKT